MNLLLKTEYIKFAALSTFTQKLSTAELCTIGLFFYTVWVYFPHFYPTWRDVNNMGAEELQSLITANYE